MNYSTDAFLGTTLNVFNLHINGYPIFVFIWNIALAVLAVLLAYWAVTIFSSKKSWAIKLGAFLLWLAIFPNAAYVMTDARHIIGYCPVGSYGRVCLTNAWMTLFFFAYAAIGWPTFVWALKPWRDFIAKRYGQLKSVVFVVITLLLTALGILLGLLNRFNSWELIYKPLAIIKSLWFYLSNGLGLLNLLITFIVLLFLYFFGEKIFVSLKIK